MTKSVLASRGKLIVYNKFFKFPPRIHERPKRQLALLISPKEQKIFEFVSPLQLA
jgi:hypothetical protein